MYNHQYEFKIQQLEAELLETKNRLSYVYSELNKSKGRAYMVMICELDIAELEAQLDITKLQLTELTSKYRKLRADNLKLVLTQ